MVGDPGDDYLFSLVQENTGRRNSASVNATYWELKKTWQQLKQLEMIPETLTKAKEQVRILTVCIGNFDA